MYKRQLSDFVICWALFVAFHGNVEASPTKRLSRMVREVYPEIEPENEGNQAQVCIVGDLVYGAEETVPAEQPCLKCKCQPPGVQCETIQCVKKPGCKAIHKSNKCCPEYQCECEHNGKIYANGEKLETPPGGECKVCYCRGGEVQCAEVSCYIRKDCEGRRVPGTCCPKYDHCPPIDSLSARSPYTTEINLPNLDKEGFEAWPVTRYSSNVTEEIQSPTSIDIQDENKIPDTNYYEVTTPSFKLTEVDETPKESILPKITIQEIIPERKEIPVTAPPRVELEPHGTLIIEEADEFLNHSNDLVVTDADPDSSEISEIFQHPPPVLRIGDKLLFLKKGEFVPEKDTSTPNSVITIIGAEGLQRGGFEDSGEVHEVRIESIPKETEEKSNETTIIPEKPDLLTEGNTFINNPDQNLDPNGNVSELNTAASTHILSLVKKKNKASTTTTTTSTTTAQTFTTTPNTESEIVSPTSETNVLQNAAAPDKITAQEISNDTSSTETTDSPATTVVVLDTLTTEEIKNTTVTSTAEVENTTETKEPTPILSSTKTYDVIVEQNPAYPPIPDIMTVNVDDTSQRFDVENTEKEHAILESSTVSPNFKILPVVLEIRSNKTVPANTTHSEWLKVNPDNLINHKASLPDELLNQPAPTDVDDNTEASTDANITIPDITTEIITTNEVGYSNTDPAEAVTDAGHRLGTIIVTTTDLPEQEDGARSTETMEESSEESRESTTKKDSHQSITTNENASIEDISEDSSEAGDMASTRDTVHNNSGEETTQTVPSGAGVIDKEFNEANKNNTSRVGDDVELVDAIKSKTPIIERNVDLSIEHMPEPAKIVLPSKSISKRESPDKEINFLRQLSGEASSEATERSLSSEEEENESQEIFKQLLEDTSTSKPRKELNSEEITSAIQRVTRIFAQHALRGQDPGPALLGFLRNQKYVRK